MKVAVIGLGQMGEPIARNILKRGYNLTVSNRSRDKADRLVAEGALWAKTPREAVQDSDIVLTVLSNDTAVEDVVYGQDGILAGLRPSAVHVSVSTISVELAHKLERDHKEQGSVFVSGTVLGRPDAAAAAQLRVLLAGDKAAQERVMPVLQAISQEVIVTGEKAEMSNISKIGINFLLASMLEALAEAQLLTSSYGVQPAEFMKAVNSLFRSPVYQNYGGMMAERRFEPAGFKMSLGAKDVGLAVAAAHDTGSPLPLGEMIHSHFRNGLEQGLGDLDWTALIRCIEPARDSATEK